MDRGRDDPRDEEMMFRNQMFFQHYKQQQQHHQAQQHPHQPQPQQATFNDIVRSTYPDIRPRYPTSSAAYPSNPAYNPPQPNSLASSPSVADSANLATMVASRDLSVASHGNHAPHLTQAAPDPTPHQQPQQDSACDRESTSSTFFEGEGEDDVTGNSFHEKLVNLMPEYSCVWNISTPTYKDKDRKKKTWEEISRRLGGMDIEYLKKEWEKLRDNYRKCIQRRERKRKKYGEASMKLPTCNFYQQLSFLAEVCVKNKPPPPKPEETNFVDLLNASTKDTNGYRPILPNTTEYRQLNDLRHMNKRKSNDLQNVVDTLFIKAKNSRMDQINDPEASFLLSFAQTLKDMPTHKRQYAKMKISELFYNLTEEENKDQKLTLP